MSFGLEPKSIQIYVGEFLCVIKLQVLSFRSSWRWGSPLPQNQNPVRKSGLSLVLPLSHVWLLRKCMRKEKRNHLYSAHCLQLRKVVIFSRFVLRLCQLHFYFVFKESEFVIWLLFLLGRDNMVNS